MTFFEWLGLIHGYFLGCFTALISFIRSSRMFHPRGVTYHAQVESDIFPPYAMIRLSSAWWKCREWPDALGIAIRFSKEPIKSEVALLKDQDMLFASFSSPLQIFISPILTHHTDFLENTYYGVGFFERNKRFVKYQLEPNDHQIVQGSRKQKLEHAILAGEAIFLLKEHDILSGIRSTIATIKIQRLLEIDQEALRFSPFQNGLGIKPRKYLQYLRIGSYKLSQWARPKALQQRPSL